MELKNGLEGCVIKEIIRNGSKVKLRFDDPIQHRKLTMTFEGLIFETPSVVLDSRVMRTDYTTTLGLKARDSLIHQNKNIESYKQLLIVLSGSTQAYKSEIICVFQDYQMRWLKLSNAAVQV